MDDRIRTHSDFGIGAGPDLPGEPPAVSVAPWHGIEQTLASVVLGSVGAIAGPTMALLIHILQETNFRGIDRVAVGIIGLAGSIGGLFVIAAAVCGLIFGILGMVAARQQHRSAALSLAGVFLCGLDVLMWLGLLICWIFAVVGHR